MSAGLLDFASELMGGWEGGGGEITTPTIPTWDMPAAGAGAGDGWGSGLWDFAGKLGTGLGKEFTESPLKAFSQMLGLGATGLGISSGLSTQKQLAEQTRTMQKGQKAALAAAAPAVAAGTEQLAESRAGKLPPPMEAAVAQWVQQAKADMRARYAQMGLGNSSDLQGEEAKIDQMALAMKAQLLQSQQGLSLEALQTGVSAGTGVAATASAQQNTLAALIEAANQQLGRLSGSQA